MYYKQIWILGHQKFVSGGVLAAILKWSSLALSHHVFSCISYVSSHIHMHIISSLCAVLNCPVWWDLLYVSSFSKKLLSSFLNVIVLSYNRMTTRSMIGVTSFGMSHGVLDNCSKTSVSSGSTFHVRTCSMLSFYQQSWTQCHNPRSARGFSSPNAFDIL